MDQPAAARVIVLVDDVVQAENVKSMARNQGWRASTAEQAGGDYEVRLEREDAALTGEAGLSSATAASSPSAAVLISSERLGRGADELGAILMRSFIKTLVEVTPLPETAVFINGGVRLTTRGSELITDLEGLADAGVDILSCGTCLDYFNLKEQLRVGRASNMLEIISRLSAAGVVIRP
jgi:tRNA 2-thiouridine synthesizing protein A